MKVFLILALSILPWLFPVTQVHTSKRLNTALSKEWKEKVYICDGKYATKFHKEKYCRGLNNCKSTVSEIERKDAENLGRETCDICY